MSKLKCPNIKIYKCSDGFVTDNAQVAKSHEANIKSNKLICPFCQQELNQDDPQIIECRNDDCKKSYFMYGSKELWQELIRTRKALDRAKWWLKEIVENHRYTPISTAEMALKEITALEQKDGK